MQYLMQSHLWRVCPLLIAVVASLEAEGAAVGKEWRATNEPARPRLGKEVRRDEDTRRELKDGEEDAPDGKEASEDVPEDEPGTPAAFDLASDPDSSIELCVVTEDRPCSYDYLKSNLPEGKTQWFVVPGGDTRCLDSDSPYGFGVFLPPDPDASNRLMVWFSGGGACFDYETCHGASPTATLKVYPETEGYFNYDLENNPLRTGNWAAVTVGYCSGDMHVGDSTAELVSRENSEQRVSTAFSGYNNTMSAMDWIRNQPELTGEGVEVAGSGCSAGSLGVQLWSAYLVDQMGASKIQPDSYIGMLPEGANEALNIWDACGTAEKIGMLEGDLLRWCRCPSGVLANCLHTMTPIVDAFLTAEPDVPIAYTGSAHDVIQRGYYALLASSFNNWGIANMTNKAFALATLRFPRYEMDTLAEYAGVSEVYSNYIVDTNQHCFMMRDSTFTTVDDNVISQHAECMDDAPDTGECAERKAMWQFASEFLNDDVYDGTPAYPEGFPRPWHVAEEEASPGFPPGDGTGDATEDQAEWIESGEARRPWREYVSSLSLGPRAGDDGESGGSQKEALDGDSSAGDDGEVEIPPDEAGNVNSASSDGGEGAGPPKGAVDGDSATGDDNKGEALTEGGLDVSSSANDDNGSEGPPAAVEDESVTGGEDGDRGQPGVDVDNNAVGRISGIRSPFVATAIGVGFFFGLV